jgi:WhiB family redox-sensing transcriptional regulator
VHPFSAPSPYRHLGLVTDAYAGPDDIEDDALDSWDGVASWDAVVPEFDGVPSDGSWRQAALCAETDPEAFFPEKGGSTREAKRVCTGCPVLTQCLEFALDNDERFGIWGGLSERERRRIRLQRRHLLSA